MSERRTLDLSATKTDAQYVNLMDDAVDRAREDGTRTLVITEGTPSAVIVPVVSADLLAAARAALPALVLLGDFIGNTFDGKVGIPAFNRCAVILALKTAIADAEALPGPWSVGDGAK